MKRLARALVCLYPPKWRKRYEIEFRSLLEDVGLGWSDVSDVLKGAIQMRLRESNLLKHAVLFGIAGALACSFISLNIPNTFASSAIITVSGGDSARINSERVAYACRAALSRPVLANMIEREDLYSGMRRNKPSEEVVENMLRHVRIATVFRRPDAFELRFDYENAAAAKRVTSQLAARLMAYGVRVERAPEVPQTPVSPNRLAITVIGLVAGAVLGVGFAFVRRRFAV